MFSTTLCFMGMRVHLLLRTLMIRLPSSFAVIGPAGMKAETVEILSNAIKTVIAKPEFQDRLTALSLESNYMAPDDLATYWADFEARQARLIGLARSAQQ